MAQKANNKMNISYTIKAIDRFTKTHARLAKQLSSLQAMANNLNANHNMNVTANTKPAMRSLQKFERKIEGIEVDLRALDTLDFEVDVNSKDALKEIKRLSKSITKIQKEIEIEIEAQYDENNLPQHIEDNLKALDKMRQRLDGFDRKVRTEIDMNTLPVFKKLKELEIDMKDIGKLTIETDADVADSHKKLDATQRKIDRLRESVEMDVKLDTRRTKRELASLEEALLNLGNMSRRLDNERARIDVEADTLEASKEISLFHRMLDRHDWMRTVVIKTKNMADMDRLATKLRNIDEIMLQMGQGLIWMLIPALGPALGIAAGGAGALAAQLIGAGAALGAFALVAIPAISHLKEMDAAVERGSDEWYALSAATRSSLTSLDRLRDTWGKLQDKFQEGALWVIVEALKAANTGLMLLEPTIAGSITALQNLGEALNKNLGAEDVKSIFEWLGSTAGGHLESLMKTLGNFFVGFMNMMVAFEPLTQDFADGFLRMSEKFREWSQTLENNKAFQDFLNFARENGPLLLSFFGALIEFLVQLGIAMAPVGVAVLKMTTKFLKWADAGLENNEWIGKAIGLFLLWRAAISVIMPIIIVLIRTVMKVASAIGFLWKWGGKLIGVFARLLPYIARLGVFFLRLVGGPIGLLITTIISLAFVVYENWDAIWAATKKVWGWITDYITDKVDEFKNYLKNTDLKTIGKDIMNGLIAGIKMVNPFNAAVSVAKKIKSGFTSFFNINSPSRVMKKDVGRWITMGVIDGVVALAGRAEREAMIVAEAIKKPFDNMSTDYTFGASGTATARTDYDMARRSAAYETATAGASASAGGPVTMQFMLDKRVLVEETYEDIDQMIAFNRDRKATFKKG